MLKKAAVLLVLFALVSLSLSPLLGVSDFSNLEKDTCLTDDLSALHSRLSEDELENIFDDSSLNNLLINCGNYNINVKNYSIYTPMTKGLVESPWPMFCHDAKHSGLSPYSTSDNPYDEIWRIKTPEFSDSGVTIGEDGMLYATEFTGNLYAIYPNGTIKWTFESTIFATSTPCIDNNGVIYVGAFEGGVLHAIYSNGTQKWRKNLGSSIGSSPVVSDDGTVYIGTMGGEPFGDSMIALNPNGTIKWQYKTGKYVLSDPAISDDGAIIFGSGDTYIYALYPNGTLKWRFNTGGLVKGPASIDEQGIIYINSYDEYLYALYPNGTLKWRTDVDGFYGTETNPSFGPDGTIYLAADGVAAINPEDGSVLWKFDFIGDDEETYLSSPVVSADGVIYVGTNSDEPEYGSIYAIDSNGNLVWMKLISDIHVASTPSIGSDGSIYICSWWYEGGAIHAFGEWNGTNHPPETPELIGEEQSNSNYLGNYKLKITGFDEDLHPMKYIVNWGDLTKEETLEVASDYEYTLWHHYPLPGQYTVRVKSVDSLGLESEWVDYRAHVTQFPSIFNIFEWFKMVFLSYSRNT